jgi:hypothetical protein
MTALIPTEEVTNTTMDATAKSPRKTFDVNQG